MDITVKKFENLSGAKKVTDKNQITKNVRLFYELGHYKVLERTLDGNGDIIENKKWITENIFKEIDDVDEFLKTGTRLDDPEFLEHHNFVIVETK